MDLLAVWTILWRQKRLLIAGVAIGVILALSSLISVRFGGPDGWVSVSRQSWSNYTQSNAVIIDLPGFGVGRTDVSMQQAAGMAPTFAYLATSKEVKDRVESKLGSLKKKVTVEAEPVEESPLVQIVVEGRDRDLVERVATEYANELVAYVQASQVANEVPVSARYDLRALGTSGEPTETQSRSVEIALILFLLPIIIVIGIALVLENMMKKSITPHTDQA
ncbi:MAG: hypothetical protein AB2L09_06905 [Coriobacteriia bacterium]